MENKEVKEKDDSYTSIDPISEIVDIELIKSAKKSEPLVNAFIKEAVRAKDGEGYRKPYNIDEILMAISKLALRVISTMYEENELYYNSVINANKIVGNDLLTALGYHGNPGISEKVKYTGEEVNEYAFRDSLLLAPLLLSRIIAEGKRSAVFDKIKTGELDPVEYLKKHKKNNEETKK